MDRLTRLHSAAFLGVAVSSFVALGFGGDLAGKAVAPEDDAQLVKKWDALIDSLASHNPEPVLVKDDCAEVPLFPPEYDWNEQRRIREVLFSLARDNRPGLWERLVQRADDDRYAITMDYNGAERPRNYTVGNLCELLAGQRLFFASRWRSDPESLDRPDIYLDIEIEDIRKWRKERAQKSLHELQIEVCETALGQLSRLSEVSEQSKERISKEIRLTIRQLRKTKTPLFFGMSLDSYDSFGPESAEKARKRLKVPRTSPDVDGSGLQGRRCLVPGLCKAV